MTAPVRLLAGTAHHSRRYLARNQHPGRRSNHPGRYLRFAELRGSMSPPRPIARVVPGKDRRREQTNLAGPDPRHARGRLCAGPGWPGAPSGAGTVPDAVLAELGDVTRADPSEAAIPWDVALQAARDADPARSTPPRIALVPTGPGREGDLVRLKAGTLAWVFQSVGLAEEQPKAFPDDEGNPMATVFLYTEYIAIVDAESGVAIQGIRR